MFGVGSSEILIIFIVVLLLFGSKELPRAAKTLGKGMRDFQRATQSARNEITRLIEEDVPIDVKKGETTKEKMDEKKDSEVHPKEKDISG